MPEVVLSSGNSCPESFEHVSSWLLCRVALSILGTIDGMDFNAVETEADWPKGCYVCQNDQNCYDGAWFNEHGTGSANGNVQSICGKGLAPAQSQMLFIGDSDIDYWANTEQQFPGSFNIGVGGSTCKDVMQEADDVIAALSPSIVVLVCGENDLMYGRTPEKTYDFWVQVVDKYLGSGAMVTHISTKPEPSTTSDHAAYLALDAMTQEYAAEVGGGRLTVIDSHQGFTDLGNPNSLYDSDQLHLSAEGYAVWEMWLQIALNHSEGCQVWVSSNCEQGLMSTTTTTTTTISTSPTSTITSTTITSTTTTSTTTTSTTTTTSPASTTQSPSITVSAGGGTTQGTTDMPTDIDSGINVAKGSAGSLRLFWAVEALVCSWLVMTRCPGPF